MNDDIMKLCDRIRETGYAIHRYHKHGHLEKSMRTHLHTVSENSASTSSNNTR